MNSRNIVFTFSTLEALFDDAVKLSVRPPLNTDSTFRLDSLETVFIEFQLRLLKKNMNFEFYKNHQEFDQ